MTDLDPYSLAEEASAVLIDKTSIANHDIALVLGSGWASAIDEIGDISAEVEMATLPGFPEPTVLGHRNLIRSLKVKDKNILSKNLLILDFLIFLLSILIMRLTEIQL